MEVFPESTIQNAKSVPANKMLTILILTLAPQRLRQNVKSRQTVLFHKYRTITAIRTAANCSYFVPITKSLACKV
jgi:hypothetical protein